MLLSNVLILWMIFMMILRITTKKRKRKVLTFFGDMISHVMSDKKNSKSIKRIFY